MFFHTAPPYLILFRRINDMKKFLTYTLGVITGIINILIGACGGIIAIEALKLNSTQQNKSHATAIAIILPLTIVSAALYTSVGNVIVNQAYVYLIPGIIGSFIGAYILKNINGNILNKIFSVFIIYSGIRLFFK